MSYPSGMWRGYWEQPGWGRQAMEELQLQFSAGKVSGKGRDAIGLFTFAGDYDEQGTVRMLKQYLGRHCVLYHGKYDGEGAIHGMWSVEGICHGPFALAPMTRQTLDGAPIQTLEP